MIKLYYVHSPTPAVTWRRDGAALAQTSSVLRVESVVPSDGGAYSCAPHSAAGAGDTHHFTVHVSSECSAPPLYSARLQ